MVRVIKKLKDIVTHGEPTWQALGAICLSTERVQTNTTGLMCSNGSRSSICTPTTFCELQLKNAEPRGAKETDCNLMSQTHTQTHTTFCSHWSLHNLPQISLRCTSEWSHTVQNQQLRYQQHTLPSGYLCTYPLWLGLQLVLNFLPSVALSPGVLSSAVAPLSAIHRCEMRN